MLLLAIPVKSFKPTTYDILPALISIFGASEPIESDAYSHALVEIREIEQHPSFLSSMEDRGPFAARHEYLKQELERVSDLRNGLNKTYTRVFLEIFELEAGGDPRLCKELRKQDANEDKLSIVFNTIANGLLFRRPQITGKTGPPATEDECCRKVLLLALAMGDPIVLCTTGRPLCLNAKGSWLSWPEMNDVQDNLPSFPSSELSIDESEVTAFVKLDLFFLGQKSNQFWASQRYVEIAEHFIDTYIRLNIDNGSQLTFWDYTAGDNSMMKKREVETFACMLECGLSWVLQVSQACGYVEDQGLQKAIKSFFNESFEACTQPDLIWLETYDGYMAATAILHFVYYVALVGIPWSGLNNAAWKPLMIATEAGQKLLIFSLANSYSEPAIPNVVLAEHYGRLPRVWILRKLKRNSYQLLGKSRLFGTASISRDENTQWGYRKRQSVSGPQCLQEDRWCASKCML